MNEPAEAASVPRTLRLKVRREAYAWLNAAAMEVNAVWNWANETSARAAHPFAGTPRWLTGFDLNNLSTGATECFAHIGAQRRGHKRQAKRLHRRAANRRKDALHKFSRRVIDQYQNIIVGDVRSTQLTQTRMAKAVLDAGWGMLKAQLRYKGEHAGRCVTVVSEQHTSRACSSCGCLSGPSGLRQLAVRRWECSGCGTEHDRDINAARNILTAGLRCRASVRGNESKYSLVRPSSASCVSEAQIEPARAAA